MLKIISHQGNVNPNHNEVQFYTPSIPKIKNKKINSLGEGVKKLETSYTC